jgi:metallophosphoesterase (TIGR03768 family)
VAGIIDCNEAILRHNNQFSGGLKMNLKKIIILVIAVCFSSMIVACNRGDDSSSTTPEASYPIESTVFTTLERTVVPVAPTGTKPYPYQISEYSPNGYGVWQSGGGIGFERRLDLMPAGYTNTSGTETLNLLRFFAISDVHITDKESPANAFNNGYKGGLGDAYATSMMFSTQFLDAAVQTINVLHERNKFDFGIALGDVTNNMQYNETRWYIDVMDGKKINPDSGIKDDPVPGPHNDYQDEFQAAGLSKDLPWYQVIGNHDHFWMGFLIANDYILQTYTSEYILNLGSYATILTSPTSVDSRGFYQGSTDGSTLLGDIIGVGAVAGFAEPPTVPADPKRRSLLRGEWMNEYLKTVSNPSGHGFKQSNVDTGFACYTFEPKSKIPIKVIVLDDTQRDDAPWYKCYAHASIDQERYDWLVSELDKGQVEGKLMIIAAHAPIGVADPTGYTGWSPDSYVTEANLITKLNEYSNLILWAAGHRHLNTVTPLPSPDPAHPELGFWQIETSSFKGFPQQFRTFEIVFNSDDTLSIFTTNVDPAVKDGSLAAISRSYAIAIQQIYNYAVFNPPTGSYNAELVKQLSPAMQAKLATLRN